MSAVARSVAGGGAGFGRRLAPIVAVGCGLRIVQTLAIAPWPPGIFNDEAYYRSLGNMLADGTGFIRPAEWLTQMLAVPTAERPPLYPLTLAGLAKLGFDGSDAQRLLGTLTGAIAIIALALIARRLAGDRAGLIAAAVAALYPTLIAADGALMTESLFGALCAVVLLAAYRLRDAPGAVRAVVLGAVLALAALSRGEALLLAPLVLAPLLRRPGGARAAAIACVAFAIVLTPWLARNWSTFDRPVLIATEGGETLRGANCEQAYFGSEIGSWQSTCVSFSGRGNEAVTLDRLGRDGLHYARDHVDRVPLVLAARLARTWGAYPLFQVPEGRRAWVMHVGVVAFFALLPLAGYGLVVLRRRGAPLWIVCTPVLTATATTLLSYGSLRFRHGAELTLVVLAAVGIDALWRRREPGARADAAQ